MKGSSIASWSGGKDSCLAYYKAVRGGRDVRLLLNFVSKEHGRCCFHGLEPEILRLQAELMGIELVQREVSADMKAYEDEFKSAVSGLIAKGADSMVFGDVYLLDHASWVDRVCGELGIEPIEPLWGIPAADVVRDFVDAGFKAVIVSCKADVMGSQYIGRTVDNDIIKEFERIGICPCGENGEFHTLVVDGPIFKRPIEIVESEPVLKEGFWRHWFMDIKRFR